MKLQMNKRILLVGLSMMSTNFIFAQEGAVGTDGKIQLQGSELRAFCSLDNKSIEIKQVIPDGVNIGQTLSISWGSSRSLDSKSKIGNCKNKAASLNNYFEQNRNFILSIDPKIFSDEKLMSGSVEKAFSKATRVKSHFFKANSPEDLLSVAVSADERVAVRCTNDCGPFDGADPCLEIFKIPSDEKLKADQASNSYLVGAGNRSRKLDTQKSLVDEIEKSGSSETNKIDFSKYSVTKIGFGARHLKESGLGPRCSDTQSKIRNAISNNWSKKAMTLQFAGFDLYDPQSLIVPAAGAGVNTGEPVYLDQDTSPPVQHQ